MRPSPLSPRQRLAPAYASASPSSVPRPPSSPARGSLIKTRFLDDKKGQLGTVTPPVIKVSKVPTLNSPRLTVLSIDGGGMRGVIPARVLKELEVVIKDVIREHWAELKSRVQGEAANLEQAPEEFDVDLADYFDLMAGTSTGSILATYLASKGEFLSPDLLKPGVRKGSVDAALNVFASQGKTIFPRPQNEAELQLRFSSFIDTLTANSILARLPQSWRYALYSQVLKLLGVPVDSNGTPGKPWSLDDDVRWKVLSAARVMYTKEGVETVLKKVFGDGNLSDGLKTSLLVSSYDLETSGPLLFCYVHDKQAAERFHGYVNLAGREQSGAEASAKKRSADPAASAIIMPELQYNLAPQTETAPHAQQTTHRDGFLPENTEKASRLDFKLWQVVRSSTAAPTFFPPANVEGLSKENTRKTFKLVDGGVCCNNPEAAALAFAMHVAAMKGHNDLRLHDAAVLSIGCGATASARVIDDTAGQLSWLGSAGLVSMFMEGANDLTTGLVQMLDADKMASGFKMQKNQLMRVQAAIFGRPPTDPLNQVLSRMDNPDDFDQLLTVGDILAQERHDEMKDFVKKFIFKLT